MIMIGYPMTRKYPPTTTFRSSIRVLASSYIFETPDGMAIPPDFRVMQSRVKKHGYVVGKLRMSEQDLFHALTWTSGPPKMVIVDKDGAITYPS